MVEEYLDVKPKSRPFKRCFKHPENTITKRIFNFISDVQFGRKSIDEICDQYNSKNNNKSSNSRSSKKSNYAQIKGYCKLRSNGLLM